MADFWKKLGVVVFGAFVITLGYILLIETSLPSWIIFSITLGAVNSTFAFAIYKIGLFGGVGQRIINVLLLGIPPLALVFYSFGTLYAFFFGASLASFTILLQDVVTRLGDTNG
ncbi:hypothetical protein [Halorubrum sp. FL23]|uniref:hypothetical protein n=1 Tax=Halorubrum sp. FL23 TaxID=3458704 RepID=UPI004034EC23